LSTLEKEKDLLRLRDDSLHSTTDSTTHVLSTLEKEEDLLRLQDDSLHSTTDSQHWMLSLLDAQHLSVYAVNCTEVFATF
jgi:hypothetical protein